MRFIAFSIALGSVIALPHGVPGQNASAAPAIYNPSWSPDGRLLYESNEGGRYAIWVVGLDGSAPKRFLPVDFEHQQSVLSPDGKRVAFVANVGATGNDIFVVNVDGSGRQNLTNAVGSQYLPRWSTDGTTVLYVSDVTGTRQRDLLATVVQSGRTTNLTNTPDVGETSSSWAPGPRIAFAIRQGDESNVFTMNADGSDRRQITHGLQAGTPTWTPNGSMVFISRHEGSDAIYTMNGDGKNIRRVLADSSRLSNVVLSPDGRRVAFLLGATGSVSLMVADTSGAQRTCVVGACRAGRQR